MLDAWALRVSAWKKKLAACLFERAVLSEAACVHVLNEPELASVRAFGLKNPVCVIPNGIELPEEPSSSLPPWEGRLPPGARVLLYLGRLHPKKGLRHLIEAWSFVRKGEWREAREWHLVVAGWDQSGHRAELQAQAVAADLSDSVHFLGPQFGAAKAAAYDHADAFILPSFSEGLPMVVLEAWAHALPVLMTPECNLSAGFQTEAAIRVEASTSGVVAGLDELFRMTDPEREAMGWRGRSLVATRFTWPRVATEMRAVYDWLLGGGKAPGCVTCS
jgi:poly(glycerol-phosphate) alpha-glucosyltransferase